MFTLRNTGKCLIYSKCGCIPGGCAERLFQRFLFVHAEKTESIWDYLKSKLGLNKKNNKQDVTREIDSRYLEPEMIELPTHSDTNDEAWKRGGYGGRRSQNKRH